MRISAGSVALIIVLFSVTLQAKQVRTVPVRIDRAGGVIVEARVGGGGPFRFLLDTGSARTIVNAAVAEQVNAPAVARTHMVSAGIESVVPIVRIASFSVGVARVEDLEVIVLDAAKLRDAAGQVDGIVGQDFLSRFSYLLDRQRKTLLWNPTAAERLERGTRLRLIGAEGRFLVELPQGSGDGLMMVPDSGTETLVLFDTPRAGRLPLRDEGPVTGIVSLSGKRNARHARVARLEIGSEVLQHEPALIVANANAGSDGLLPLRAYRQVLFDNAAKTVTLWR